MDTPQTPLLIVTVSEYSDSRAFQFKEGLSRKEQVQTLLLLHRLIWVELGRLQSTIWDSLSEYLGLPKDWTGETMR
jgi:hypothetical protein